MTYFNCLSHLFSGSRWGFCIYIAPYVLTGYQYYDVPFFIVQLYNWYQQVYGFGGLIIIIAMLLPFLTASLMFFGIARILSVYVIKFDQKKSGQSN